MSGAHGPERVRSTMVDRATSEGGHVVHLVREGETTALCGEIGMTNLFRSGLIVEPYSSCQKCKDLFN